MNAKKLAAATVLVGCMLAPRVHAAPDDGIAWNPADMPSACPEGRLIIDVTQRVLNGVDIGSRGNAWAQVSYTRRIQVVQTGTNLFCATVTQNGAFTTIAGPSPAAATTGGVVASGVAGTFYGGYVSGVFTAVLRAAPDAPVMGALPSIDRQCSQGGSCAPAAPWAAAYFAEVTGLDAEWWGWTYTASNGNWVNNATGDSGDITGTPN